MFPRNYMNNIVISRFKSSTTRCVAACCPSREGLDKKFIVYIVNQSSETVFECECNSDLESILKTKSTLKMTLNSSKHAAHSHKHVLTCLSGIVKCYVYPLIGVFSSVESVPNIILNGLKYMINNCLKALCDGKAF